MSERGANINENEMEQISVKIQSFVCEGKKKKKPDWGFYPSAAQGI